MALLYKHQGAPLGNPGRSYHRGNGPDTVGGGEAHVV
jgi:hypothetical protein